jgi:hypothetical protein
MGRGILIALLALGTVLGFGKASRTIAITTGATATAVPATGLTRSKIALPKLASAPRNAWDGSAERATPRKRPHRLPRHQPRRPHRDGANLVVG